MGSSSSALIKRCPSRILLCSLLPAAMLLLSLLKVINSIHNNYTDNLCGLLPLFYWRSFIESSKAKYQMEKTNKQKIVSQDFSRKWLDEGYMVLTIAPLQSWNFTLSVLASGLTWACIDLVHMSQLVWAPVCASPAAFRRHRFLVTINQLWLSHFSALSSTVEEGCSIYNPFGAENSYSLHLGQFWVCFNHHLLQAETFLRTEGCLNPWI